MKSRFRDIQSLEIGNGSCREDYIFLYGYVSLLRPKTIVEIGTNLGVGSISMALALKDNNIDGHIYTFEMHQSLSSKAKCQANQLKVLDYIDFHVGESDSVKSLNLKEIDLAFIDGNHTYEGVKKDFENLKHSKYIIFHDTQACGGVKKFIEELKGDKVIITNRPNGTLFNGNKHTLFNGITLMRGVKDE